MKNITITILSILLLITGGYLLYDKVLMEEDNQNINDNENKEQEINKTYIEGNDYEELIKELQEKVKFTYGYFDNIPYCGDGTQSELPMENSGLNYYVSKEFKSYQEMFDYLKTYMTEDIINSNFSIKKENYLEKDGKLYCENFGKGSNIFQPKHFNIQVNKMSKNEINSVVAVELYGYEDKDYQNYDVEFTKSNDNWIISSYKLQS